MHVAIIMDGNGRWAEARGLPRTVGHLHGLQAMRETVKGALELGIDELTLYAFSSENWRRPQAEVSGLMRLVRVSLSKDIEDLYHRGVRVHFVGDLERLPKDIQQGIIAAEQRTEANNRLILTLAVSYGARGEMVAATRALVRDVLEGRLELVAVTEECFASYLWTGSLPDPDIIIRPGGEKRLSNFLLWKAAYSRLVFLETLWPDFTQLDLENILRSHQQATCGPSPARQARSGGAEAGARGVGVERGNGPSPGLCEAGLTK